MKNITYYIKRIKRLRFLAVKLFFLLFPSFVLAQITLENPLKYSSIEEIIDRVSDWIFYLGLVLVPLMIVIGAFMMLTSAGEPGRVKKGKSLIMWTLIGFAIILFSKG